MNNIFNTSFEISLRILITLNTTRQKLSIERITALDFISIYGKEFNVSEYNLHGDNNYRFCEYTIRREIISKALKDLVLFDYVKPHCNKSGFKYSISQQGISFCHSLNDEYASSFSKIIQKSYTQYLDYSDRKLTSFINKYAVASIGGHNNEIFY